MNIGKKLSSLSLENASATREQESESDGLKRVKVIRLGFVSGTYCCGPVVVIRS